MCGGVQLTQGEGDAARCAVVVQAGRRHARAVPPLGFPFGAPVCFGASSNACERGAPKLPARDGLSHLPSCLTLGVWQRTPRRQTRPRIAPACVDWAIVGLSRSAVRLVCERAFISLAPLPAGWFRVHVRVVGCVGSSVSVENDRLARGWSVFL